MAKGWCGRLEVEGNAAMQGFMVRGRRRELECQCFLPL